jgi:hypothetical protein
MPLLAYFTIVGSTMTAALLMGSVYFPAHPLREVRPVDKSVIRIHSARVVPAPVELVSRGISSINPTSELVMATAGR